MNVTFVITNVMWHGVVLLKKHTTTLQLPTCKYWASAVNEFVVLEINQLVPWRLYFSRLWFLRTNFGMCYVTDELCFDGKKSRLPLILFFLLHKANSNPKPNTLVQFPVVVSLLSSLFEFRENFTHPLQTDLFLTLQYEVCSCTHLYSLVHTVLRNNVESLYYL